MEDYINGCYTKYGTRSMNVFEIKISCAFGNGLGCNIGYIDNGDDGYSIDITRNGKVIAWEHRIQTFGFDEDKTSDYKRLVPLAVSRMKEMKLLPENYPAKTTA